MGRGIAPGARRKRRDWFNLQFSVRPSNFSKLSFTNTVGRKFYFFSKLKRLKKTRVAPRAEKQYLIGTFTNYSQSAAKTLFQHKLNQDTKKTIPFSLLAAIKRPHLIRPSKSKIIFIPQIQY
jgi:hypothetical protein